MSILLSANMLITLRLTVHALEPSLGLIDIDIEELLLDSFVDPHTPSNICCLQPPS